MATEMVQELRVCPLRFSIALLFAFRTALMVPQYSTQISQGLNFEKLRHKKVQFPMFAGCSVGFGSVWGDPPQPSASCSVRASLRMSLAGEREGSLSLL